MRALILRLFLLLAAIVAPAAAQSAAAPANGFRPTVILVSLDGFRYDYPEKFATPNLHRIIREGVRSQGMVPAFPSKTFTNHYTLVTGLYAEHHGVVANTILDPRDGARLKMSDPVQVRSSRWWGGEPIWVTLARQGQKSAATFWPGSEAEIGGVRPAYWRQYDENFRREQRVELLLSYLDLPAAERPTFLTLYFEDVDTAGHDFGPDSPQMRAAVEAVDSAMGLLLRGLEQRGLLDRVNLIVTADHGMAQLSTQRIVYLDDYYDARDVDVLEGGALFMARSRSGNHEALYQALRRSGAPLAIYRKADLPERFRLKSHPLVPPIVGMADEGWRISTRSYIASRKRPEWGTHGYDNALPSMHAFFAARGPGFRRGATVPRFESVHVYSLMAHLLRVKPAKTDGSLAAVRQMLR